MPGWPANGETRVIRVFDPSVLETARQRAIDVMSTWALAPRANGLRIGDRGSRLEGWAYAGDPGPLQNFRRTLSAPSTSVREGLNQLLPGTTGLPDDFRRGELPGRPV